MLRKIIPLIVPFCTSLSSIEKSNCSKLGGGFLLNLQAKVKTLIASGFLPLDRSHLGDSGKKYHRVRKGIADSPMNNSRCFILGIRYTRKPRER